MNAAAFAIPGALSQPTGGYAYARRVLRELDRARGHRLVHWPLPEVPARPAHDLLAEIASRFSSLPDGMPVLIDGLALGALPAELIAALPGPAVALCHHPRALETGIAPEDAAWFAEAERAALSVCATVVVTSDATGEIVVRDYAVAPERLVVAPPGTDPAPLASGSGEAGPTLLSVGSLTPRKGHDLLISALAELSALDWRLIIAGAGDPESGYGAELKAQAAQAGLAARIRFLGPQTPVHLSGLYDQADLFVLASRYEGYGMVFAEAIARGLPVVGPRIAAVEEATRGAAHLVPVDDASALAAALRPLIEDLDARADLARASRSAASSLPRWVDTAARIGDVLAAVTTSNGGSRP